MPFNWAFAAATHEMMSQAHALNNIGINIANVSTGGYRRTETHFATLLSRSLDNESDLSGVRPRDFQRIDEQGFMVGSPRDLDVALNGKGVFIVNTEEGARARPCYTRDGSFQQALGSTTTATNNNLPITVKQGFLADKNGYFVQGFAPDANGDFPSTGTLQSLRIDQFAFQANNQPTTTAKLHLNLPAGDAIDTTRQYSIEVVDSAGQRQSTNINFTRRPGIGQWTVVADQATQVPQVNTLTLSGSVEVGDKYSVFIAGNQVTYTVTASDSSIDTIAANLVAAIGANATANGIVTATAAPGGVITLTGKTAGTPFLFAAQANNSATPTAQVDRITIAGGVNAGDVVRATINGTPVNYTVLPGDVTVNDIRDGLIAAINANGTVNTAVTASPGGAGVVTITSDTVGTAFTLASSTPTDPGADTTATAANVTPNVVGVGDNAAAVATPTEVGPVLQFDANGQLTGTTSVPLTLNFGTSTASVTLDLSLMTQFDGDFTPFSFERNGFANATIVSLSFDSEGHLSGSFDDATQRRLYKLPFALFSNPNGLEMKNGNVFAETQESGTRTIEDASSSGFASFQVNTRELANVDLVDEFSRMIQVQNAYNSSATVFRTVDEMLMTARDLAR
ncbi:MAG: flagellar hook-basal body complex protein [Rhodospirillales bacterium]|jgi:flagellar hook protein FlgE|nr:flagellar hook-basal body complex protein [Rhodospirillales bacterium]